MNVSTADLMLTGARIKADKKSVNTAKLSPAIRPHFWITQHIIRSKGMLKSVPAIASQYMDRSKFFPIILVMAAILGHTMKKPYASIKARYLDIPRCIT
ncbi:MAG: hypothetical protein DRG39_07810 [Deltaproteobacteria bacterium]|nr:MAG: hypothetical protein DRG39_07810 [Deltaproteobacteria bacterium]